MPLSKPGAVALLLLLSACSAASENAAPGEPMEDTLAATDVAAEATEPASDASEAAAEASDAATSPGNPQDPGATGAPLPPPPPPAPAPVPPAPPTAKAPCAATGTRETAQTCAAFADQLGTLKGGFDAYRPAESMVRDKPTLVRYSLAIVAAEAQAGGGNLKPATDPAAGSAINAAQTQAATGVVPAAQKDTVKVGQIKAAQHMFACLKGAEFKIEPAECAVRDTVADPNPVWEWQVTPTRAGTFKLYLTSGIELQDDAGHVQRIGNSAPAHDVVVTVDSQGRFKDTVDSLTAWVRTPMGLIAALTALVAAIAGLIAGVRKLASKGDEGGGS